MSKWHSYLVIKMWETSAIFFFSFFFVSCTIFFHNGCFLPILCFTVWHDIFIYSIYVECVKELVRSFLEKKKYLHYSKLLHLNLKFAEEKCDIDEINVSTLLFLKNNASLPVSYKYKQVFSSFKLIH